jgi:hypothetical protein
MLSGKWVFRHRGLLAHLPLIVVLFWRRGEVSHTALMWSAGFALLFGNPLYIANAAICASAAFFARLPWLAPFVLLWVFAVYSAVVRYEEGWQLQLWDGPYQRYLQQVPRWFPRLSELRRVVWWNEFSPRALRAELHCLLIALIFGLKGLADSPAGHLAWAGLRSRLFS